MFEDKILLWKFKTGNIGAFRAIYDKYGDDLMNLAVNLLNDTQSAEDVVQDVLVKFVQSREKIKVRENLKGYLLTSVANRCRDYIRSSSRRQRVTDNQPVQMKAVSNPVQTLICREELEMLSSAMTELPFQQQEVILLYLHGNLKFREIAKIRNVSIKTVQSQYRYGLNKLRSLMNGEVRK